MVESLARALAGSSSEKLGLYIYITETYIEAQKFRKLNIDKMAAGAARLREWNIYYMNNMRKVSAVHKVFIGLVIMSGNL